MIRSRPSPFSDELTKERKSAHSALAGVAFGPEEACKYVYRATDAALATARNDALEEAAKVADCRNLWPREGERIATVIRALKSETKP